MLVDALLSAVTAEVVGAGSERAISEVAGADAFAELREARLELLVLAAFFGAAFAGAGSGAGAVFSGAGVAGSETSAAAVVVSAEFAATFVAAVLVVRLD